MNLNNLRTWDRWAVVLHSLCATHLQIVNDWRIIANQRTFGNISLQITASTVHFSLLHPTLSISPAAARIHDPHHREHAIHRLLSLELASRTLLTWEFLGENILIALGTCVSKSNRVVCQLILISSSSSHRLLYSISSTHLQPPVLICASTRRLIFIGSSSSGFGVYILIIANFRLRTFLSTPPPLPSILKISSSAHLHLPVLI